MNVFIFALMILSLGLVVKSLLAFFGKNSWIFYLLSHFRFQYFLAGIVLFVALIFLNPIWSIAPLVAVLANAPFLRNKHFARRRVDLQPQFRVMSANIFIANFNYEKIAESIRASKADVVVLYEIFEDTFQELKKLLSEYPTSYFDQSPKNLGMATFVKSVTAKIHSEHFSDPKIASVVVEIPTGEKTLSIVGYHTDAPMSPKKYRAMKVEIAGLANFAVNSTTPLLVVGDFNDTTVSALFHPLFKAGLKDSRKPFERAVTWPLFLPGFLRLTLDHILTKNGAHVVKRTYGERTGSDHTPVVVDVSID